MVDRTRVEALQARYLVTRDGRATLQALLEWIDELAGVGEVPLVLLDIDSTLFHTDQRNLQILYDFAAHYVPGDKTWEQAIGHIEQNGTGWNIVDDVIRFGIQDLELLKRLRHYWMERFFSSDYLRHDLPVQGSAEFVRECYGRGAFCYYLTGRDEPNMRDGTIDSLYYHGFPMGKRTHLHMKDAFLTNDLEFKRNAADGLRNYGEVLGIFENEPANANLLHRLYPSAMTFFLETMHSPGAPPVDSTIFRVRDFQLDSPDECRDIPVEIGLRVQ